MCAVSMVGDHYRDTWKERPWYPGPVGPVTIPPSVPVSPYTITLPAVPEISRAEFDDLKRQVLEMKELLKRAKKYDEDNGEPACEIEEKMDILRKVAKLVGVDLSDVIGTGNATGQRSPA